MPPRPLLARALPAAVVLVVMAGCDEAPTNADPQPSSVPATTSAPAPDPPPTAEPQVLPDDDPLVVVTHATRPQLRLTAAQVSDLVARRGTPGVAGSVRAVEGHSEAVGVVPLSEVGPSVVAAVVDGVDPVRDHEGATSVVV